MLHKTKNCGIPHSKVLLEFLNVTSDLWGVWEMFKGAFADTCSENVRSGRGRPKDPVKHVQTWGARTTFGVSRFFIFCTSQFYLFFNVYNSILHRLIVDSWRFFTTNNKEVFQQQQGITSGSAKLCKRIEEWRSASMLKMSKCGLRW